MPAKPWGAVAGEQGNNRNDEDAPSHDSIARTAQPVSRHHCCLSTIDVRAAGLVAAKYSLPARIVASCGGRAIRPPAGRSSEGLPRRTTVPQPSSATLPLPHHPPSLPIHLKLPHTLPPPRIKPQMSPPRQRRHGNHIPGPFRSHISHQNINLLRRISLSRIRPMRRNRIPIRTSTPRRLHLHPPQPPAPVHNKVIPPAISPRTSHPKPQLRRLRQKLRLRRLPRPLPHTPPLPAGSS
jgi:hypothetical protein